MEPKKVEELAADLVRLEADVTKYLEEEMALVKLTPIQRAALTAELMPAKPPMYRFYEEVSMSAPAGSLPMLVTGGWYDQPYYLMLILRACHRSVLRFKQQLKRELND